MEEERDMAVRRVMYQQSLIENRYEEKSSTRNRRQLVVDDLVLPEVSQ